MQMNTVGKSTDFISTFFLYKIKNDKEYVTQKISVLSFLKSKYMR